MTSKLFFLLLISYTFLPAQKTQIVTTKSGPFPVIDEGKGVPVLLLHGFPDTKELWTNQVSALVEEGYRVIAPTLRGYGEAYSPLEKEQYAISILMTDVIEIMDELDLDKVHLVGHDWGAVLAWQLVQFYPQNFLSLTALSVGFPGNSAWASIEQRQMSWYFYLFLQEGLAEKTFADYHWKFAREFLHGHKQVDEIIERFQKPHALTTALNWYRGNMQNLMAHPNVEYRPTNNPPAPPQRKMNIPVLGVWSEMDFALSEAQMKQSTEIANDFTYRKIENAGHWMMLDQPEELNSIILSFLNEH